MIFNTGDYLRLFKVDDETTAINSAYKARSGYVHTANPLRDSALVGTSTRMPVFASMELFIDDERAPPIIWLEHIVAESFLNYVNAGDKK